MTTQKKKGRKPKKRRAVRPTLWGMELAPIPPHLRDKKESVLDKAESQAAERPRSRGIALLIVLTMLVLSTTITLEMQFDSRVQLQLAANSRNAIQAEYLARSSLQFVHLLLAFDKQFQRLKNNPQLKAATKMMPQVAMILNRLQLWKIAPVDSAMLKKIAGGAFGAAQKKQDDNKKGDQGKLYPFGEFQGRFGAKIEDESSKINLNRFENYGEGVALKQQLFALFAPEKYNPIFERTLKDGSNMTRMDMISVIADWVDRNRKVEHEPSNTEDSKYRYPEHGYTTKDYKMYSIEELRLLKGVDDIFFQTFGKLFTVFGRVLRTNIAEADKETLRALIVSYANIKPQDKQVLLAGRDPNFNRLMDQLMIYRSIMGFPTTSAFMDWMKAPRPIDPRIYAGSNTSASVQSLGELPKIPLKSNILQRISVNADTFKVECSGQVGNVVRRLTAVIYVHGSGKRDVQYWRLH